jgi:Fe2+ or Zn2+ uptake regulation protein
LDTKGVDAGLLQSRYRLTRQRAAILRALEDGAHLTAETILERVRMDMPGVSLGTIYRTLDILRSIGLVQLFSFAGTASRYEAALDKHHHLVCVICHEIVNVPADVRGVAQTVADAHRYDDVDASLTITGRCPGCSALSSPHANGTSFLSS